ncbi:transcriptional regulator [Helicobacter sp. faydin-H20]|uniref:transcriptional regulator n=1 Tax=Helicobacter anatolicus TaxID=2905874 RepID=UPI001E4465F0|nr:transcriptional regulator [Helicobacter anatolicus]MCE3037498.1 transcriptional regulator [Helicobacter anatolicus]
MKKWKKASRLFLDKIIIVKQRSKEVTADELKAFCKEQNLTYKELAKHLGLSEGGLTNAITNDKITASIEHNFKMYQRILKLENDLKDFEDLKILLEKILKK